MARPEILFLAHRIPYPPDRGDKIRSWHFLKHLAGLGTIHLACFADDAADFAHLPALKAQLGDSLGKAHVEIRRSSRLRAAADSVRMGVPLSVAMFDSATLRTFVGRLLRERQLDAIFAFSGQMAQFVPDRCPVRFVMDMVDVDSAKFAAYSEEGGPLGLLYRREAARLAAFESSVAARAQACLFVSEAEAALFRARAGLAAADIRAVGNGVDLGFFDPDADFPRLGEKRGEGPILLFTGQMDYPPNVVAVAHFARNDLPAIRRRRGDARFVIAGRNPAPEVKRLAGDGIVVTGSVPDIRTWLAAADVVVAPLRIARGVQNKVLEAMAMARPVVASPAAFEGIDAEPDRDLIVCADPAEAVLGLLGDPDRATSIGKAARDQVVRAYRWEQRLAPLAEILLPDRHQVAA